MFFLNFHKNIKHVFFSSMVTCVQAEIIRALNERVTWLESNRLAQVLRVGIIFDGVIYLWPFLRC